MIVVDASVILEVLLRTPESDAFIDTVLDRRETLHAPHLLDVEVAQVLRRYTERGAITADRGSAALELLVACPITRYGHEPLLPRMWELRHNLTAYDAAYVALAEGLRARLVTRDRALAKSPGLHARVQLI